MVGDRDSLTHHLLKGSSATKEVVMRRSPPQRHADSFNPESQIIGRLHLGTLCLQVGMCCSRSQ